MSQLNTKIVDSAFATLISADSDLESIESARVEDLKAIESKFRNAQKLAKQKYDSAGDTTANIVGKQQQDARVAAERLAGQNIQGFEQDCERRGVTPAEYPGGTPRPMSDLADEVKQLGLSWKRFDELNSIEASMNAESKPWMMWVWLGALVTGFVALFVMSIVPV